MLDTARLDPAIRLEHPDAAQMRVFRGDPAEIVPHAAHDPFDLRRRQLGQRGAQIVSRPVRDAETGPDPSGQRATQCRGGIERQPPEYR